MRPAMAQRHGDGVEELLVIRLGVAGEIVLQTRDGDLLCLGPAAFAAHESARRRKYVEAGNAQPDHHHHDQHERHHDLGRFVPTDQFGPPAFDWHRRTP